MMSKQEIEKLMKFALTNPEEYWSEVANLGFWFKPWTQTLDSSNKPLYKWFIGGETNICYNLLDRHVLNGNGDKTAAICESAATTSNGKVTFNELLEQVSRFAGVLQNLGVVKGDVVFSYMPNILELTVVILATWRIGGVVLTLLPNTTANALADRIELSKPKIFITSNATQIKNDLVFFKKPLDEAIQKLNYNAKVVVFQRKEFEQAAMDLERDILWEDVMQSAEPIHCVPTDSNQASLISCSSGTTGKPKGITFSTGGFLTALCNRIRTEQIYAFNNASVTLVPSHPGWISGIYGFIVPLIDSCCGIIYDGDGAGNGDIDTLYRIIAKHRPTTVTFNLATLRDLRLADPDGIHAKKYDLSSVVTMATGGEVLDQLNRDWADKIFQTVTIEAWGQTEGLGAIENKLLVGNKDLDPDDRYAKFTAPGLAFKIFDEEGHELPTGQTGFIAAKLPLPPTSAQTLFLDDDLYIKEYCSTYPGYFNSKDLGWMDKNGGLHIVGRGDDVMKVSGVTMTTIEAENAILLNTDIAECVVVPLKHTEMYLVPVAFYILKEGINTQTSAILEKMKVHMKESFGPAVIFDYALQVKNVPKSLTGKITRKLIQTELQKYIKEVSHGDNPETILQKMREAVKNLGMV